MYNKHHVSVAQSIEHIGRGGQSVKDWRGVKRHVPRAGSPSAPSRNVVADTVCSDGVLVFHSQVRREGLLGAATTSTSAQLKVTSASDGKNQLGKEVDAKYEKRDDEPLRGLSSRLFALCKHKGRVLGQSYSEFSR